MPQTLSKKERRAKYKVEYARRKKYHIERIYKKRAEIYKQINLLKDAPCTDCKQKFPPIVMDFDHLPHSRKTSGIARLIRNTHSMERIIEEIAKCELVCANCHRIRTSARSKSVFTARDKD